MIRVRSFLLACFCALSLATVVQAAGPEKLPEVPLSQAGFTNFVAEAFRKAQPDASVTIAGPLQLSIRQNGEGWQTYLFKIYSFCLRNTGSCAAGVALHVEQIAASHNEKPKAAERSDLRVVVRPVIYVEQAKKHIGDSGEPIAEPICGELWTMGVIDRPTTVVFLEPKHLAAFDLSPNETLDLAKQYTKEALRRRIPKPKSDDKNSLSAILGDSYTSSLFAFPELFAPLAQAFDGKLIVAVPSTDQLFYIGDDSPDALTLLRVTSADEWRHAMRPLSRALYRWTEKGWEEVSAPKQ